MDSMIKNAGHDATDIQKSNGQKIVFEPVLPPPAKTTQPKVEFKAFITKFKDDHKTKWDLADKWSGMGVIVHRHGPQSRVLNFSFDVPAYNTAEAMKNLSNITTLVQMMFPTATNRKSETKRVQWKINFANMIKDFSCIVEAFSVTPNFDVGVFFMGNTILPKLFSVDISARYQPLKGDHYLRSSGGGLVFQEGDKQKPTYPYGVPGLLSQGATNKAAPGKTQNSQTAQAQTHAPDRLDPSKPKSGGQSLAALDSGEIQPSDFNTGPDFVPWDLSDVINA